MKEKIRYAHCIKFTPGCLDREPFSMYELREQEVEIKAVFSEDDKPEWAVFLGDKMVAVEESLGTAEALAAYELMNKSRDAAAHAAQALNQHQGVME